MKKIGLAMTIIYFILALFSLPANAFQTQVIQAAEDVPGNMSSLWAKGDLLLFFGEYLAVIGNSSRRLDSSRIHYPTADALGSLISLAPAGQNIHSDICIGSPYLRLREKQEYIAYNSLKQINEQSPSGNIILEATGSYTGFRRDKVGITTKYIFHSESGQIEILSNLQNTGSKNLEKFSYSLYFGSNSSYSFSPYDKTKFPELNFSIAVKPDHSLAWINAAPANSQKPATLAPGESLSVHYFLMAGTTSCELLEKVYQKLQISFAPTAFNYRGEFGELSELIISEAVTGQIFFRRFMSEKGISEIPLPTETYTAQVNFFPATVKKMFKVGLEKDNSFSIEAPALGKLSVQITDDLGNYVPGKITFQGIHPTSSPYFAPDDPIKSQRYWERFKNSCFPGTNGQEVSLPVGTYLVYAACGPEYTLDTRIVEILKGDFRKLTFRIKRIVDSSGLISLDPHMHTQDSDGRMDHAARVRSVVAEGVNIAVSSEHNTISDYLPAIKAQKLSRYLAYIYGNEVTISGMIHYNTYPVARIKEAKYYGAIDPLSDTTTPLFQRSRKADPNTIIQVNHPRSGRLGYFNQYQLDPESAAFALEGFDTSFDVLEVLNGPSCFSSNAESVRDWLNLLNRGYYYPLTGSSDSHGIDRSEPGYSRTYILYDGPKGADLDLTALIFAIKEGRSFASNGPIITAAVNQDYTYGDTLTDTDGSIDVELRIQCAPWVAAEQVKLIINGKRKIGLPLQQKSSGGLDIIQKQQIDLQQDSYIVFEVQGGKSLFPVLQSIAAGGRPDKVLLPYALTNPIFIDVDGNGKFDPPVKGDIELVTSIPQKNPVVEEKK